MADHIDTDAMRRHFGIPSAPQTQELDAIGRLCAEVDRLRDLLAKALPWIDPNDRHEDYLLTVAIREALGEPT